MKLEEPKELYGMTRDEFGRRIGEEPTDASINSLDASPGVKARLLEALHKALADPNPCTRSHKLAPIEREFHRIRTENDGVGKAMAAWSKWIDAKNELEWSEAEERKRRAKEKEERKIDKLRDNILNNMGL